MSKRAIVPAGQERLHASFGFSGAVEAAGLVVCSGLLGVGSDRRLSPEPAVQFVDAFRNVEAMLAAAGCGWDDVVELTTFHVGLRRHIEAFTGVKARFVTEPFPAWTAIGVVELAMEGALVEIRAVALKPA